MSGNTMNSIATHALKKKKSAYDRTIIHKYGWTARIHVPMKSGTVANYESSDEDNVLLNQHAV